MKITSGVGRETAHGSIMLSARKVAKALENKWVNLLSNSSVITPKWGSVNNVCSE